MDILHIILILIIIVLAIMLFISIRKGASYKRGIATKPISASTSSASSKPKEAESDEEIDRLEDNSSPDNPNIIWNSSTQKLPEYEAIDMAEDFLDSFISINPTMKHLKNKQSGGKFYFKLRKANYFGAYKEKNKNTNADNIDED